MDLLQLIIDYWQFVGVSITIAVAIIIELYRSRDKIRTLRRLKYWWNNSRFEVNIASIKHYPSFKVNIDNLKRSILREFSNDDINLQFRRFGANYLDILIDGRAPYSIDFTPYIENDDDDTFNEKGKISVSIKLIGTITFRYNEDNDNEKYFSYIEKLFNVIERSYNKRPVYQDHSLISTYADFDANWKDEKKIDTENGRINIGLRTILIHFKILTSLYSAYKKYLPDVPLA